MTIVSVQSGDITQVESDGLITAINSGGMWFGGIDGAIMRSGNFFHSQASAAMPLSDGQVVFARAMDSHNGRFGSVIFVVDDLRQPLRNIVSAGLQEAERQQLERVTIPTIRTGVMAGAVEPTVAVALEELAIAINQFVGSNPRVVRNINVVVFNDPSSEIYLKNLLG